METVLSGKGSAEGLTERYFDLLVVSAVGADNARAHVKRLFDAHMTAAADLDDKINSVRTTLLSNRQTSENRLTQRFREITQRAKDDLEPGAAKLATARDRYLVEFLAAGLSKTPPDLADTQVPTGDDALPS